MKNKMHQTSKKKNKNIIHISNSDLHLRNEMHFSVQLNTKAQVYKDKTKYTRKTKHKNMFNDAKFID